MENDYKFVSKFVEGKTYKELTDEEIEKLKSGIGVKKEDKEYIDSLKEPISKQENSIDNETDIETEEILSNADIKEEDKEFDKKNETITQENINKSSEGVKVIKAIGNILKLENGKTIKLNKEQLKEKSFWRKGDVYYG